MLQGARYPLLFFQLQVWPQEKKQGLLIYWPVISVQNCSAAVLKRRLGR